MHAGLLIVIGAFAIALAGCDPKKPSEPKPPTPKVDLTQVDFTHERST
jgi:hypothetical protein